MMSYNTISTLQVGKHKTLIKVFLTERNLPSKIMQKSLAMADVCAAKQEDIRQAETERA